MTADPHLNTQSWAVAARGLGKAFGALQAVDHFDLLVPKGTIHGLIGENGAGKSTAMKMLFGMIQPDAGQIEIFGERRQFRHPKEAIAAGLGMVHQHFMVAESLSVLDNVLLGKKSFFLSRLPREKMRSRLTKIIDQFGFELDLDAVVSELSVGMLQRLEILKLLERDAQIIILDEPTAVLSPLEIQSLFAQLKQLRAQGRTILLITHKLKEMMALADEVTVMRAGRVVGHRLTKQTNASELAELMIGRRLSALPPKTPREDSTPPLMRTVHLNLPPKLNDINLSLHPGEIVGIAGVEGNGQSDLLRTLLSPNPRQLNGSIDILGEKYIIDGVAQMSWAKLRRHGIGVLGENRQRDSLLMNWSLQENFLLGHEQNFQRCGVLQWEALQNATAAALSTYSIRPAEPTAKARALSGGNQQKLVVARELQNQPRLILAAHPTRGVDLGAIDFIHRQLLAARNRGASILLISSELDEIKALSDRIWVFYRGAIVLELDHFDEKAIGLAMGGGS